MKLDYTKRFIESLHNAPPHIQMAFYKQSQFMLDDLRHPSLRTKKYDETRDVLASQGYTRLEVLLHD